MEQLRKLESTIEINGDTYRVKKLPVASGMYLMKILSEKILPLIAKVQGENEDLTDEMVGGKLVELLPEALASIGEEDINQIVKICLNSSEKSLPAGWQKCMIGDKYGIEDLEYDYEVCLGLIVESIMLNCGGFFGGNGFLGKIRKIGTGSR